MQVTAEYVNDNVLGAYRRQVSPEEEDKGSDDSDEAGDAGGGSQRKRKKKGGKKKKKKKKRPKRWHWAMPATYSRIDTQLEWLNR